MKLDELDFEYPEELVATERATLSRTLLIDPRPTVAAGSVAVDSPALAESVREISRRELLELFRAGDLWVVNETRVLKRRVFTRQNLEILFIRPLNPDRTEWDVLCPSSRWKPGTAQTIGSVSFELVERGRPQKIRSSVPLGEDFFDEAGELPLPPYIQKARGERHSRAEDDRAYQSPWARAELGPDGAGSLAAPTASFHFDDAFVSELKNRGVAIATVTLHVGLGTFLPVTVDDLDDHVMHAEFAEISKATQDAVRRAKESGGRVIAVGTTVTRTLESWGCGVFGPPAADGSLSGETTLLIRPGYQWKVVDVLLTNFHQPRSTLFALVAAFADLETVRRAYAFAFSKKFRLFSYGDLSVWLAHR